MIRESVLAFTLMAGANGADLLSTRHAVAAGGVEANALYGPHAERAVPLKVAVIAAETGIFIALRRDGHKRAAWLWVVGVVGTNLYIAHRNEQLARRLR